MFQILIILCVQHSRAQKAFLGLLSDGAFLQGGEGGAAESQNEGRELGFRGQAPQS